MPIIIAPQSKLSSRPKSNRSCIDIPFAILLPLADDVVRIAAIEFDLANRTQGLEPRLKEIMMKRLSARYEAIVPASALQFHPKTRVFIDEEAASELKRKDYYRWVFDNKPHKERDFR